MNEAIYFDSFSNNNHASLALLIDRLFEHRSRILVIRVDFNYLNEYRHLVTLEMAQEHRKRFLDNRRRNHTLFNDLLGYAWSLEHGSFDAQGMSGSGFHHHFVFFYDGATRQQDIRLGLGIADYFKNVITGGMGHCYVSNCDKDKLSKWDCLGIGMIHRDDVQLRNNLLQHVAGYLTKPSFFPEVEGRHSDSADFRTFGRSRLLPPVPLDVPRKGRPARS